MSPALITYGIFALAFVMAARLGRWYLFQTIVFAAVMCAGIYFRWTIGGYAMSIVAYTAAFIATRAVAVVAAAVGQLRLRRRYENSLELKREAITQERRV